MIVKTFKLPYKNGDTIKIKPIFDVHWGNKYCDKKAFRDYLANSDDKTYFIGGGDMLDSIVIGDKRYEKHVDDTEGDAIIDEQVDGFTKVLEPYKDKLLGLGRGNHEKTIIKRCSTDPVKRMCEALQCDYLGYSGLLRLVLSEGGSRGRTAIIRWHHGWGGGSRTQGADLTKYSNDVKHWVADLYLYGHVHRKQSDRIPRLGLSGEKLISRPKLIGICGTFLRTYSKTQESTYSEEKGYPPVEIGGITVNFKPDSHKWMDMWIDL